MIPTSRPRASTVLGGGERVWPESNCYVDLWIALSHDLGLDPSAFLACAVAPRFEGDQWTFCKPTATELAELYAVRVEELTVWRDLRAHVRAQLELGRVVLVEVDAFHLPDTAGVSYGARHQKTTIGIRELSGQPTLGYYHNSGYFELAGEEVERVLESAIGGAALPPFAELVDLSRARSLPWPTLRQRSIAIARRRLDLAGSTNPFATWADHAERDLERLRANDLDHFHAWAFASVRQAGAMSELLAIWCEWLGGVPEADVAAGALRSVARALKMQQFRLARVPLRGSADLASALHRCAHEWGLAQSAIREICAWSADDVSRAVGGALPAARARLVTG